MQRPVGGHECPVERKQATEVGDRPGDRGDEQAIDHRHLVGVQRRRVQVDDPAAPCTGHAAAGDVHSVQPDRPQRQAVHHSGREVTQDGVGPEPRQGRPDRHQVARGGVRRRGPGPVRAGPHPGVRGATAAGGGVGVRAAVGEQLRAEVESWPEGFHVSTVLRPVRRPPGMPVICGWRGPHGDNSRLVSSQRTAHLAKNTLTSQVQLPLRCEPGPCGVAVIPAK